MRYSDKFHLLFYIGVGFIIFFYIGVVLARFKDEKFDFNEHKWIAFTYIVLMILTIWLWRYIFDIVFNDDLLKIIIPQGIEIYG